MSRPVLDPDEHNRRRYESPAVGEAICRQIRSLVARCEEGDTEALEELARVEQVATRAQFDGARGLYRRGYTWQAIGDLLGVTRQAASARFRGDGGGVN
jgi:predicted transcriptional regulator